MSFQAAEQGRVTHPGPGSNPELMRVEDLGSARWLELARQSARDKRRLQGNSSGVLCSGLAGTGCEETVWSQEENHRRGAESHQDGREKPQDAQVLGLVLRNVLSRWRGQTNPRLNIALVLQVKA